MKRKAFGVAAIALSLMACNGDPAIVPAGKLEPLIGEWIYVTQRRALGRA